jgi:hypothetical protein
MDNEPTRPFERLDEAAEPETERLGEAAEPETEHLDEAVEPETVHLDEPVVAAPEQVAEAATREVPMHEAEPGQRNPLAEAGSALAELGRIIGNYAVYSVRAALSWAGAGRRVTRLRREIRAEQKRRGELLLSLGEAALLEDEQEVAGLRERVHEIDARIAQLGAERGQILRETRARLDRERTA